MPDVTVSSAVDTFMQSANTSAMRTNVGLTVGSADNCVVRADGTGGNTVQGSDLCIKDAATATANNVTLENVHSGQTNSSFVISPKGSGALILGPAPDGTATGGNARGTYSVDLQIQRAAATGVTSGSYCFAAGYGNNVSATAGAAVGSTHTASGSYCFAAGLTNTASANYTVATGNNSLAQRHGQRAHASGVFASTGDCQESMMILRGSTSNTTPTELFLDGSSAKVTLPSSGYTLDCNIVITAKQASSANCASFWRRALIVRNGTTTALEGSVATIGTDIVSAGLAGAAVTITADDAGDYLKITVTGIAATNLKWMAIVRCSELINA